MGVIKNRRTKTVVENTMKNAVGGGSNYHAYSTTEQKVGEWIDGSDLYEKTFVFDSVEIVSGTQFDLTSTNANLIFLDSCFMRDERTSASGGYGTIMIGSRLNLGASITADNYLLFEGSGSWGAHSYYKWYVTVKYTKATV